MMSQFLGILLSIMSLPALGQDIALRLETWPEKLATEDRTLRVDVAASGAVQIHRPAHWTLAGDCRFTLQPAEFATLQSTAASVYWSGQRAADLAGQVAQRDQSIKESEGIVFETSDRVVTVLTRDPERISGSEVFVYENLDWDAERHPEIPDLKHWSRLSASLYALATDERCMSESSEVKP